MKNQNEYVLKNHILTFDFLRIFSKGLWGILRITSDTSAATTPFAKVRVFVDPLFWLWVIVINSCRGKKHAPALTRRLIISSGRVANLGIQVIAKCVL